MNKNFLIWIGLLCITTGFSFAQKPVIEFESDKYKFGKVKEGQLVIMKFPFQNLDSIPVIFNSFKVNCSCTLVQLPNQPIPPFSTDTVTVSFDSYHKIGFQQRTILIKTSSGDYNLIFQGVVKASEKTKIEYKNSK